MQQRAEEGAKLERILQRANLRARATQFSVRPDTIASRGAAAAEASLLLTFAVCSVLQWLMQ
jgi:hypothetical protein